MQLQEDLNSITKEQEFTKSKFKEIQSNHKNVINDISELIFLLIKENTLKKFEN